MLSQRVIKKSRFAIFHLSLSLVYIYVCVYPIMYIMVYHSNIKYSTGSLIPPNKKRQDITSSLYAKRNPITFHYRSHSYHVQKNTHIYIYIYIEIGSNYTWCNFIIITHFLNHWFQKDLTVKNASLNVYYFWHPYLINCIFFFSLFLSLFIPLQIPPH